MNRDLLAEAGRTRRSWILCALLQLGAGLCLLGYSFTLSRAIARVWPPGGTRDDVARLLLWTVLLALARAVLTWGAQRTASDVAVRIRRELRERLVSRLVALGPAFVQGERSGELVGAAGAGIDALDPFFRDYLPALLGAVVLPLSVLAVVLPRDGLTFAVLLVTGPLIPLFMWLIGKAAGALAHRQYAGLSFLSAHFLDVLQGLSTLKLFNRSRAQIETIARIADEYRTATMGVLRVAFLSALVLEMVATVSVAIVAVEVALRLMRGGVGFEQALFLLVIAPEFYQPLRTLGARFHTGAEAGAAAERIFALLGAPVPAAAGAALPADRTLRFEDVHMAFDGGERAALAGLTFELRAGERVALVGESGGGKSTAAALLLKFVEPASGRVTVGGVDLAELDAAAWRAAIAWVPQRPHLFAASAVDNIRLGQPGAPMEAVIAAAQAAEAHDFLCALPQGYETPLGEGGVRLSGGEAQRIALARAFLKDAPLLILDEATAWLDAANEAAIQRALRRLLVGRTALLIAHRLHTVADADRIVVVQEGRAVEAGEHATLLAQGGVYAALVAAGEGNRGA